MKRYNSKISAGLVMFLVIVVGSSLALMISKQNWLGVCICVLAATLIIYLLITTYYLIDGANLIIKSGFIINISVRIDRIKEIKETNNPLSSPAASFDRLAIYYDETGFVMVSPRDKTGFIEQLSAINPHIEVSRKKAKA